jgi:hypothetical protein
MPNRIIYISLIVALVLTSSLVCNFIPPSAEETPTVDAEATLSALKLTQTFVAQTIIVATPSQPPDSPPTYQPALLGSISGALSYPSEGIPALRIVAHDVNNSRYFYVETLPDQTTYKIAGLPPGDYYMVAYAIDLGIPGGYTHAVACGLGAECSDHSLIPVQVNPNQEAINIDPIDWYAPEGSFPPDPLLPSAPVGDIPLAGGKISGRLSYPSEGIPPMYVVAFRVDTGTFYFVDAETNQGEYMIENLPPGVYHVVAYPVGGSLGGGYTQAVPCGLSVDCNDHSLIDVHVVAGQETSGVDPADWYAPEGAFPPNPIH